MTNKAFCIDIVILNWNGFRDTLECLQSLQVIQEPVWKVWLVDNASKNNELQTITNTLKKVGFPLDRLKTIANQTNRGFSGGNNVAIKKILQQNVLPTWVMLLNNDTIVDPLFFDQIKKITENIKKKELHKNIKKQFSQGIGSLAPSMLNYFQNQYYDNLGHNLLTNGDSVPRLRNRLSDSLRLTSEVVMGNCGGAALYKPEMLLETGLLDEDFFLNYEDADLSLRSINLGWACATCPKAIVYHKINQSIKRIKNKQYSIRSQRNQLWAYFHNAPLMVIILNSPWILIREIGVIFLGLVSFRWSLVWIFILSRYETLRSFKNIYRKRNKYMKKRRVSWYTFWQLQTNWVSIYYRYFLTIVIQRKSSVMNVDH